MPYLHDNPNKPYIGTKESAEEFYTDWPDPADCDHEVTASQGICRICGAEACPECKVMGDDEFEWESHTSFGNSLITQRTCLSCDHTIVHESEHTEL